MSAIGMLRQFATGLVPQSGPSWLVPGTCVSWCETEHHPAVKVAAILGGPVEIAVSIHDKSCPRPSAARLFGKSVDGGFVPRWIKLEYDAVTLRATGKRGAVEIPERIKHHSRHRVLAVAASGKAMQHGFLSRR